MKPNSGLVAALLMMFSVKSIASIPIEKFGSEVANKLAKAMTDQASDIVCELTKEADASKQSVYLSADSPDWDVAGFSSMSEDERIIFRRVHENYGREMTLTKDGLIVFPRKIKKLDPITAKAVEWVEKTSPQVIKKVLQFTA